MKILIIDGNNLIHKIPKYRKLFKLNPESVQLSLLESIRLKLGTDEKLILFFDGFGNIKSKEIRFSGSLTADELIKKYIEENYTKQKITVVSSDTGITGLAKVCCCKIIKSEDFLKEIKSSEKEKRNINQLFLYDKEKPEKINKTEFEEFRKYFT